MHKIVMARETIPCFQGPLLLYYPTPNKKGVRHIIGYIGKPDWNSDATRRAEPVTAKVKGGPVTWAHGPVMYLKYTLGDFINETSLNNLKADLVAWKKEMPDLLTDSAVLVIGPER